MKPGHRAVGSRSWLKDEFVRSAHLKPRLNVRNELKQFRQDPLLPLIRRVTRGQKPSLLFDEPARYVYAYRLYYLSVERFYRELSLGYRWRNGPYFVLKYGGKYNPYERRLATEYNRVAPFLELDFLNCILHARIVLDRAVALARYFLPPGNRPSFASFADHKKFFLKLRTSYGSFNDYAEYIRKETSWFDDLKQVRDKVIVHQGPKHARFFGYPIDRVDLDLSIDIPQDEAWFDKERRVAQSMVLSGRATAAHIDRFLHWFSRRGLKALRECDARKTR